MTPYSLRYKLNVNINTVDINRNGNSSSGGELKLYLGCTGSTQFNDGMKKLKHLFERITIMEGTSGGFGGVMGSWIRHCYRQVFIL